MTTMSLTATAEKTTTKEDKPVPLPQLPDSGTTWRRDSDSTTNHHQMSFPGPTSITILSTLTGWNIGGDWRSPPNPTQVAPSTASGTLMIRVPAQVPLPRKMGMVTFLDPNQYFQAQVPETRESEDSNVKKINPMEALHMLEDNIWDHPSPTHASRSKCTK
jgi:hypothetical protein